MEQRFWSKLSRPITYEESYLGYSFWEAGCRNQLFANRTFNSESSISCSSSSVEKTRSQFASPMLCTKHKSTDNLLASFQFDSSCPHVGSSRQALWESLTKINVNVTQLCADREEGTVIKAERKLLIVWLKMGGNAFLVDTSTIGNEVWDCIALCFSCIFSIPSCKYTVPSARYYSACTFWPKWGCFKYAESNWKLIDPMHMTFTQN